VLSLFDPTRDRKRKRKAEGAGDFSALQAGSKSQLNQARSVTTRTSKKPRHEPLKAASKAEGKCFSGPKPDPEPEPSDEDLEDALMRIASVVRSSKVPEDRQLGKRQEEQMKQRILSFEASTGHIRVGGQAKAGGGGGSADKGEGSASDPAPLSLPASPFEGLSPQQQAVRDVLCGPTGRVWLCGPAGVGKSAVIGAVCEACVLAEVELQVCASTGLAAAQFASTGARTLHSWAGLGRSTAIPPERLARMVAARNGAEFQRVQLLIIDEVSMLGFHSVKTVDLAMRQARGSSKPFGGCRVLAVGDFLQLPPVESNDDGKTSGVAGVPHVPHTLLNHQTDFRYWFPVILRLSKIFRQSGSADVRVLAELRGRLRPHRPFSAEADSALQRMVVPRDALEQVARRTTSNAVAIARAYRRHGEGKGDMESYEVPGFEPPVTAITYYNAVVKEVNQQSIDAVRARTEAGEALLRCRAMLLWKTMGTDGLVEHKDPDPNSRDPDGRRIYEDAVQIVRNRYGTKSEPPPSVQRFHETCKKEFPLIFAPGGIEEDAIELQAEAIRCLKAANLFVVAGGQRYVVGMPVMLRTNIDPSRGLYNGKQAHILGFTDKPLQHTAREIALMPSMKLPGEGAGTVVFGEAGAVSTERGEDDKRMPSASSTSSSSSAAGSGMVLADRLTHLAKHAPWGRDKSGSPVIRLYPEGRVLVLPPTDLVATTIRMRTRMSKKQEATAIRAGRLYSKNDELKMVVRVTMLQMATSWTVHKAQGSTFEGPVLFCNPRCSVKMRQPGLVYVAMSRTRKLRDLKLVGCAPPPNDIFCCPEAKVWDEWMERAQVDPRKALEGTGIAEDQVRPEGAPSYVFRTFAVVMATKEAAATARGELLRDLKASAAASSAGAGASQRSTGERRRPAAQPSGGMEW